MLTSCIFCAHLLLLVAFTWDPTQIPLCRWEQYDLLFSSFFSKDKQVLLPFYWLKVEISITTLRVLLTKQCKQIALEVLPSQRMESKRIYGRASHKKDFGSFPYVDSAHNAQLRLLS